jgi:hypothetical protein
MSEGLRMWVIYDHPRDFPSTYVARLWLVDGKPRPTGEFMVDADVERLRDVMQEMGLVKLMRADADDPVVMETWL